MAGATAKSKDEDFHVLVPSDLKTAFEAAAEKADRPTGQVIIDLMRDFVSEQQQPDADYDEWFRALGESSAAFDCLCIWGLPQSCYLFEYITTSPLIAAAWYRHLPEGYNPRSYWLKLPATFQEYLAQFTSKTRNSFKRTVRGLKAHGHGALELTRIESTRQIPEFVAAAAAICRRRLPSSSR